MRGEGLAHAHEDLVAPSFEPSDRSAFRAERKGGHPISRRTPGAPRGRHRSLTTPLQSIGAASSFAQIELTRRLPAKPVSEHRLDDRPGWSIRIADEPARVLAVGHDRDDGRVGALAQAQANLLESERAEAHVLIGHGRLVEADLSPANAAKAIREAALANFNAALVLHYI